MKSHYQRFDSAIRLIASRRATQELRTELVAELRNIYSRPLLALDTVGREAFLQTIERFASMGKRSLK